MAGHSLVKGNLTDIIGIWYWWVISGPHGALLWVPSKVFPLGISNAVFLPPASHFSLLVLEVYLSAGPLYSPTSCSPNSAFEWIPFRKSPRPVPTCGDTSLEKCYSHAPCHFLSASFSPCLHILSHEIKPSSLCLPSTLCGPLTFLSLGSTPTSSFPLPTWSNEENSSAPHNLSSW